MLRVPHAVLLWSEWLSSRPMISRRKSEFWVFECSRCCGYPAHILLTYPRGGLHTLSFLHHAWGRPQCQGVNIPEIPSINEGWELAEKHSNGLAFQRDNSLQTLRGFWEDWTLSATVVTWSLMHTGFPHVWLSSLPHTFIIFLQKEPKIGFDFRSFAWGQISSKTPEIKFCLRLHLGRNPN